VQFDAALQWNTEVRCSGFQGETSFFIVVTKEITMLLRTLTTTALLALGITAAHAADFTTNNFAANNFTQVSVYVPYGDLNLAQPSDAKILADRLEEAAKSVCLKANPDIDSPVLMQQCIGTAISVAMVGIEDTLDQEVRAKLVVVRTSMANP
jgi:UrcA family protein